MLALRHTYYHEVCAILKLDLSYKKKKNEKKDRGILEMLGIWLIEEGKTNHL